MESHPGQFVVRNHVGVLDVTGTSSGAPVITVICPVLAHLVRNILTAGERCGSTIPAIVVHVPALTLCRVIQAESLVGLSEEIIVV